MFLCALSSTCTPTIEKVAILIFWKKALIESLQQGAHGW